MYITVYISRIQELSCEQRNIVKVYSSQDQLENNVTVDISCKIGHNKCGKN